MNPKLAPALTTLALLLAGCGNKGPLVLAEPPAPAEELATPAGEVPVEQAPDTTAVDPAQVPTSELEPVDAPTTELPIDPATVPDSEVDAETPPVEPVAEPPPEPVDPAADDDGDG